MAEIIEGLYEWTMEYKRSDWMSLQEFYNMNMDNIERHLLDKHWKWVPLHIAVRIIYSDIVESD